MQISKFQSIPVIAFSLFLPVSNQAQEISESAKAQIREIMSMKRSLSPSQRKQSSELLLAGMRAHHRIFGNIQDSMVRRLERADGTVLVDLKANHLAPVLERISDEGGQVVSSSKRDGRVRAALPVTSIDKVSDLPGVDWIRSAGRAHTNGMGAARLSPRKLHLAPFVGAVTSQGYVTHTADQSVAGGFDGTGVKVGVLSDSALPGRVAALIASGDLPPDTVILPGQAGNPADGADEGAAMMEIVHDLAPGAKLFFATAFTSDTSFADNIRTLRFTYGCDIIVDDVAYSAEGAFQDGTIAQAVNDVVTDGALYFSAAGNEGNLSSGTSGTWEGDFQNGGDPGQLIDAFETAAVSVHNFGTGASLTLYDTLTGPTGFGIELDWSDPLGKSTNDYDLIILNSAGTAIKGFSAGSQTGTQDPVEFVPVGTGCGTNRPIGYCPSVGDRIMVVLYSGSARALRVNAGGGTLAIGTAGSTVGHNAGLNTVSTAATYWNSAGIGTFPFTGAANPIERFSSDGPRKIFYNPNGSEITPGNVLFATNGGTTLQKPDITAADGIFTKTPRFLPFFGTSAAAPHAASVAALVKSANPSLTNAQIKQILLNTAVDNMAPGVDRDSGYGIVMALPAVQAVLNPNP